MNVFQVAERVETIATLRCCYCTNVLTRRKDGRQNFYKDEMVISAANSGWRDSGGGDLMCESCAVNGRQMALLPLSNTGVNK